MQDRRSGKTGILLSNLGTPDAPTPAALRRYLAEFLSDPRIVSLPRLIWWPILHGIILRLRPKRSARAYQVVWTDEGSPLLVITRRQFQAVRDRFADRHDVVVEFGMRYGRPSIASALDSLLQAGVERIIVLPLYPQYSVTTSASTADAVSQRLAREASRPAVEIIHDYHGQTGYIAALASSIEEHWRQHGRSSCLLFSFHGTPQSLRDAGDPYYYQCRQTVEAVVERLSLRDDEWRLTFQSRFGWQPWLQPYTDKTLEALAQAGVRRVDVICPGFSADCLETLEEIREQNREIFIAAGGEEFHYIPALNERPDHIEALYDLLLTYVDAQTSELRD